MAAACSDGRLRYVTTEFDAQRALIAAGVLDTRVGEADCDTLQRALKRYDGIYGAPTGETFREKVDKIMPLYPAFVAAFDMKEVTDTGWPVLVPGLLAGAPTKGDENEWYFKFKSEDLLFISTYRFGVRPNPPSKHLLKSMLADSSQKKNQKISALIQSAREFRLQNLSAGDRVIHRSRQAFVADRFLHGLYIAYPDAPMPEFVAPGHLAPLIAVWKERLAIGDPGPGLDAEKGESFNEFGLDAIQREEIAALAKGDAASRTPAAIDDLLRRWIWRRSMSAMTLLSASHFEEANRWKTVKVENCLTAKDDRSVRVVFATNREATGKLGESVLAETWFKGSAHAENDLTIGCAVISTPATDKVVEAAAVEARSSEHDAAAQRSSTAFTTLKATPLATTTVEQTGYRLRIVDGERRLFDREDRVLVYVHGYNTPFETALFQAAQIAAATKYPGRVYLFSWPSAGRTLGYLGDMDSAERSEAQFTGFLRAILSDPALREIDLVGHSMGAQILTRSLNALLDEFYARDRVRLGQVVLAAPDISTDVFTAKVLEVSRLAKGITIYGSAADWPLWGSGLIRRADRLGLIVNGKPADVPGAKYVTATPTDNACTFWGYGSLGHSYLTENPAVLRHMAGVLSKSRAQERFDEASAGFAKRMVLQSETPTCWWRPVPRFERQVPAVK